MTICMPSPGTRPFGKCAESWNAAVSAASTMSDSNGISPCRHAGPLIAAITGTSMFSRFISRARPSQCTRSNALAVRPWADRALAGGGADAGPFVAGAGQDHHPVVAVARDVGEGVGQFAVRPEAPAQRAVVGMEPHLQDAVLPPHVDAGIFRRVVVEPAHRGVSLEGVAAIPPRRLQWIRARSGGTPAPRCRCRAPSFRPPTHWR